MQLSLNRFKYLHEIEKLCYFVKLYHDNFFLSFSPEIVIVRISITNNVKRSSMLKIAELEQNNDK